MLFSNSPCEIEYTVRMKAFLIDPQTRSVTQQVYDGQPNSLYTLFNSLLVDQNDILHGHMVYSATEAYEKKEPGYFLGEKLMFGKALVTGYAGFEDLDADISAEELTQLITFELPEFYTKALALLPAEFSFDEHYELQLDAQTESVRPEWVLYVFNMADSDTKNYFLTHLESAVVQGDDLHGYLKKMGMLAIKSMQ